MCSRVLKNNRAIDVNIAIVPSFVEMYNRLATQTDIWEPTNKILAKFIFFTHTNV